MNMNKPAIKSSWNAEKLLMRGPLTDRKIEEYQQRGYYSPEYRQARRELMERKKASQEKRIGNFLMVDGRMVYSP